MKIETTYSDHELCKGKCKSCGEITKRLCLESILDGEPEGKYNHWCPDCIEAIKFEEMTQRAATGDFDEMEIGE